MARCIVCGFDGSNGSRHAAPVAARLARDLKTRALLVSVNPSAGSMRRVLAASLGRARRMRGNLRTVAEEHCFPDDALLCVKVGDPARTLMSVAGREDAELILVGAGGQSTISPTLLGEVTTTLVLEAPCPVVVVPRDTVAPMDSESMRSVVCAVAGAEPDSEVQRLGRDLAARLGGDLHAVPALGGEADQAESRFATALDAVARRERAGLIVVGLRNHTSVAAELAGGGQTPVVVLPSEARLDSGSGHYELAADPA